MIYFRGCVVRNKLKNIETATKKILDKVQVNYEILDDEGCCGSFLHRTGFEDDAQEIMKKNLQDIKDERILVSCAGCYNTLKNDYKEIFGVELDVIHTSQFFASLIEEGKLKIEKTSLKVTYHDPCHLGRYCGEYQAPRDILEHTAHLVNMDKEKDQSRCCGAGAGVKAAFPEVALKIAKRRLNEAKATDADVLVTACSFCILNLSSVVKSAEKDDKKYLDIKENREKDNKKYAKKDIDEFCNEYLEVIDLSELILMGMDHESE